MQEHNFVFYVPDNGGYEEVNAVFETSNETEENAVVFK